MNDPSPLYVHPIVSVELEDREDDCCLLSSLALLLRFVTVVMRVTGGELITSSENLGLCCQHINTIRTLLTNQKLLFRDHGNFLRKDRAGALRSTWTWFCWSVQHKKRYLMDREDEH